MSKFNFKKIAIGLAISAIFSSCFVSNVVDMESVDFEKISKFCMMYFRRRRKINK